MNFIDFLNQSNNIKKISTDDISKQIINANKNNKNKDDKNKEDNKKIDINNENLKNKLNKHNIFDDNKNVPVNENHNSVNHLKIGTFIKIVHYKNSPYNVYKGYIGEIKDIKQNSNTAVINLHAINENRSIILPIDHFIIYNY